jgi:hypothetical protein
MKHYVLEASSVSVFRQGFYQSISSTPTHHVFLRSNFLLFYYLNVCLPSVLFLHVRQQKFCAPFCFHHAFCKTFLSCSSSFGYLYKIFWYISDKMQSYTVYFYLETALHVSGGGTSTHSQECKQLYLQHLVFVTPLLICRFRGSVGTGLSVLWVAYATHSTLKPVPSLPR